MLTILSEQTSIVNQYLMELRDVELQKDRRQFERNLERLGTIAGYELSKQLSYTPRTTTTPLGTVDAPQLTSELVITTILRAGIPVQRGLSQVFDRTELSFIAAGRKPETPAGVEIDLAYVSTPDLTGKTLIIADTMLATGNSIVDAYNAIVAKGGQPQQTFVVAVVSAQPGIDFVQQHLPDVSIIVTVVDPELNDKFYIVPGLGDAGDLLYGFKK
jgi:uracil phosphoribosyltransferase